PSAEKREILFMPPSNPAQESWTGHIITAPEARKISGVEEIWDARRFQEFLTQLIPQTKDLMDAPAGGGRGGRAAAATPAPIPVNVAEAFGKTIATAGAGELQVYMVSTGRPAEFRRELEFTRRLSDVKPAIKVTSPSQMFGKLRQVKSPRELDLLQHA